MNKTKFIIILWIFSIIVCSGATGYITYNLTKVEIVVEDPKPDPVVAPPVKRKVPIKDMSCELVKNELWHYDNDPMKIDWVVLEQNNQILNMEIRSNLYQRTFTQRANIGLTVIESSSGNWKLGLGIGIGAVATIGTGYVIYKLFK